MPFEHLTINDANFGDFVLPDQGKVFGDSVRVRGTYPRTLAYGENPYALPMAEKFEVIPRSQWDALIDQKDAEESWLYDRICRKIPVDNQNGLGYCHAYGLKMACQVLRDLHGLEYVDLSAESVGGEVTNWRNEGATLDDDLRVACTLGFCEKRFMDKDHSLRQSKWQDGWEANRAHYLTLEAWDLSRVPRGASYSTFDIACTCAFKNIPFDAGYLWWLHAVAGGFKVARDGRGGYKLMSRQSWGVTQEYGEDGFFYMTEGKGTPDLGLVVPRQMVMYNPQAA